MWLEQIIKKVKMKLTSRGFGAIEILLVVVLVAGLSLVGYSAYQTQKSQSSLAEVSDELPSLPAVEKADDLTAAAEAVDQLNTDTVDGLINQLDSDIELQ